MDKELNEDARTKQDLLYECSRLESKLSNEIIKSEHLEQQCKKQKEVIDRASARLECFLIGNLKYQSSQKEFIKLVNILKEGKNER